LKPTTRPDPNSRVATAALFDWSRIRTVTGFVANVWAEVNARPAWKPKLDGTFARIGWPAWAATSE
jgi:hypothetical protein